MPKGENTKSTSDSRNESEAATPATMATSAAIQQPPPMRDIGNLADNWTDWKKTFDWYLIASGREKSSDREKCALFLHTIGKVGRELYEELDLLKSEENDYTVLCNKFTQRCSPQKNVNFERHLFFETYQSQEDFDKFFAVLRVRSKSCEFGNLRDSLILTQLIRGIKDSHLRERMLSKTNLKLEDAVACCRAAEVASEQAGAVRGSAGAPPAASSPPADLERVSASERGRVSRSRDATDAGAAAAGASLGSSGSQSRHRSRRPRRRPGPGGAANNNNCWYCDGRHARNQCPAYNVVCYRCDKLGHYAKCCKSGFVKEVYYESENTSECEEFVVNGVEMNSVDSKGWFETIKVNGKNINFKLDCGADACTMSKDSFLKAGFDQRILKKSGTILRKVSKTILPTLGYFEAELFFNDRKCLKKIYVLNVMCNNLLSREACTDLNLILRVNEINGQTYNDLLKKYENVFQGIGRLPGTHKLTVDENVPPVVSCSRKIPIKMKPKLQEELDRLVSLGIIERVDEPTDWVSSIVLVEKPDGSLRLCIDPKHLNKAIKRSHFQLPTLDEITANLSNAKYFSHLDASKAFFMIVLDKPSSKLCTFATPFGRYKFLRLPFGICSASEVFHNAMYKAFSMEGVEVFVDDLLIHGSTKAEHDARLAAVLRRAAELGVRFNRDKCVIGATQVKYLGHIFNAEGMRPDPSRIQAIQDIPPPDNKKELERFLGMSNYLSRFIPNYSDLVEPLRQLLKRNADFLWHETHTQVFNRIKENIMKAPTLRYYNPNEEVVVSVDASSRGLGACLLQGGRPVAFAARTLTPPETRWAQIEKELLAIVYGCSKFHQFIYGHKYVTVESDHKPLEAIFKKMLHDTPMRLQRMLLRLQKYSLNIRYVPGRLMYVADTLSRVPLVTHGNDGDDKDMHIKAECHVNALYDNVNFSPDKLLLIKQETGKDKGLVDVKNYYNNGWPHTKSIVQSDAKPYWIIKDELHVINDIVFRGNRVVIPASLRREMLQRIHEGHLGIEKCKRRARDIMWWPGMSSQVEAAVRACAACAERQPAQPRQPLQPHAQPERPWEVLATDIFQLQNKTYLLVVDYYSKFVEVATLHNLRSSTVISLLKSIFARHGIPKKLVSDNALQFESEEFKMFSASWEFEHVTSSPYYARSNGLAERHIQTVKKILEKANSDGSDSYLALLNLRNTAITGERYSPAQLLMGRRLNTRLPISNKLLDPETPNKSEIQKTRVTKIKQMKKYYDSHTKTLRPLGEGEQVRIREPRANGADAGRWVPARVQRATPEPRSYWVRTPDGGQYRRNRQHIRAQPIAPQQNTGSHTTSLPTQATSNVMSSHSNAVNNPRCHLFDDYFPTNPSPPAQSAPGASNNTQQHYVTRSGRQVRPPDRYQSK